MSSILSHIRSLFRSGELPLQSTCSISVTNPHIHGLSIKVNEPDFELPNDIFDIVNDTNVKDGYEVKLTCFKAERTFQHLDGRWKTTHAWNK